MNRVTIFLVSLAALALLQPASAQVGRSYQEGPVTLVTYLKIEYGHFDEYIEWLNSTWKPFREAQKTAGLITDYKVFTARPKRPDEPNVIFMVTYPNMAGLDRRAEEEAVAEKMIGSAEAQNKARVGRSDYRKVLGSELIREVILQ
jgi:hypothetical protein